MFEVKTYELGYCDPKEYTRVICVSKYKISTYGLLCYCEIKK